MGLHNTAHYLKSKGRGTDTELVHMSKNEIRGLQQLAMANGGSLTINPDTGLVEAGFLEQALPVVAAAAATYFTAGAAAPALSAALGSSMAGGIAAGALAGAGISGITAALTGKDVGQAALMGGLGGGISGGLGAYADAPNLLADATQKAAVEGGAQAATQTATQGATEAATQTATNALPTGYTGTAFSPAEMAAGSGPASSLNTGLGYDPSTGIGSTPMAGYGTAQTGMPTQAQLQATQGFTGMQSPSPAGQSFYADQGMIGKAGILALPAAGLLNTETEELPGEAPYVSPLKRISSNFQAYQAPQPNPYYQAQYPTYTRRAAAGGLMSTYQTGGPVERMTQMNTAMNPQGGLYPQGMIDKTQYATPTQRPTSLEVIEAEPSYDARVNPITGTLMAGGGIVAMAAGGEPLSYLPKGDAGKVVDTDSNTKGLSAWEAAQYRNKKLLAKSGIKAADLPKTGIKSLGGDFSDMAAAGGVAHLGDYSDGGRLLKGPGDGVSDSIPATIGGKQPARLADGEFVVPARIVSELGNGSTEAGAKRLYAMMDRIQKARKKSTGKNKVAIDSKANKLLPA